MSKIGSIR